jgi:hypothetical protein
MARISYSSLICLFLLLDPIPLRASEARVPYGPMRPQTVQVLRKAIKAVTVRRDSLQKNNLAALDEISLADWPQVASLRYVRIELRNPEQSRSKPCGWLLSDEGDSITWLTIGFEKASERKIHVRQVTPVDFRSDLHRLCSAVPANVYSAWYSDYVISWNPSVVLIYLAYASAELGFEKDAQDWMKQLLELVPTGLPSLKDELAWQILYKALFKFSYGSHPAHNASDPNGREEFLRSCKRTKAAFPACKYASLLTSLIDAMEMELRAPLPSCLNKKVTERSLSESIQYWIYQLRDLSASQLSEPGSPDIFSSSDESPTPADQIVAAGADAIPMLIQALEDATPTRTLVDNRFRLDEWEPLRRQDIAFQCLERIVGCRFYPAYEKKTFIAECPQARASALAHVRNWWKISQGKSQAQMVRNYLASIEENKTLRHDGVWMHEVDPWGYERLHALRTLANLEGPEAVIGRLANLNEERFFDEPTLREWLNPKTSLTDEQVAHSVATIEGPNPVLPRTIIAGLENEASYRIQRALLRALEREPIASERLRILRVLRYRPMPWHLVELTKILACDGDETNRVEAGEIIAQIVGEKSHSYWWDRLENRDSALALARKLLCHETTPAPVRYVAFDIIVAWDSFIDAPLVGRLRAQPVFQTREVSLHFSDILENERTRTKIIPLLIGRLECADPSVRARAAQALGRLSPLSSASVFALASAINDKFDFVAEEALHSLGNAGPEGSAAIPVVVEAFASPKRKRAIRGAATEALIKLDPSGAATYSAARRVLRDTSDPERSLAIELLGRSADARAMEGEFRAALESDDSNVREAADDALRHIAGKEARK